MVAVLFYFGFLLSPAWLIYFTVVSLYLFIPSPISPIPQATQMAAILSH